MRKNDQRANEMTHAASTDKIDETSAELWIRYDATSSMASDFGQITVAHAGSGRQWTVELDGRGPLAKPAF